MSFTKSGNQKMVERLKAEKGIDAEGKSVHHKLAGQAASHGKSGYFAKLQETEEGRAKLREIGQKGAQASNIKQGKGIEGKTGDKTTER